MSYSRATGKHFQLGKPAEIAVAGKDDLQLKAKDTTVHLVSEYNDLEQELGSTYYMFHLAGEETEGWKYT